RIKVAHQTDGNVVVYWGAPNYVAMWSTRTHGRKTTALVMQQDGNLVLYNGKTPLWASNTGREGQSRLVITGAGDLIIQRVRDGRRVWLPTSSVIRSAGRTRSYPP